MSNTYTFRQIAYITIEVVADTEDEAYDKMCDIDPLTGDIDYEEPELESSPDLLMLKELFLSPSISLKFSSL